MLVKESECSGKGNESWFGSERLPAFHTASVLLSGYKTINNFMNLWPQGCHVCGNPRNLEDGLNFLTWLPFLRILFKR